MKLVMRKWQWLTGCLAGSLICATYLLAQTPTGIDAQMTGTAALKVAPPTSEEIADCDRLIDAVNAGDAQTACEILHNYGVADDTLQSMATRLGTLPPSVELKEPFLKASVGALALTDRILKTNVQTRFSAAFAAQGYERPVWIPRRPNTWAIPNYDPALRQCPQAPILVLNERLNDPCFIRYFKLYDRYAADLHSVVLNGAQLSNAKLDSTNYAAANRELNALFQLIKARKPDAFVWLSVVKEDDRSDEKWLQGLAFRPDGLQIANLSQFHSPFAQTRQRYLAIMGTDLPMMVENFYGYKAALIAKGDLLDTALKNHHPQATTAAMTQLDGIGTVAGSDFADLETYLQSLGYRGLSAHWLLLTALANATNAAAIDKSDLLGPRAGSLDTYYGQKDYAHVLSLATEMVSESAPGDMSWTVGKLYQGIALLSQTPPDPTRAITVLDQILSFDFQNRPGRDHYILGAVKWRIYAASLSGDKNKMKELAQWVQNRPFRKDLKSEFLKQFNAGLIPAPTTSK